MKDFFMVVSLKLDKMCHGRPCNMTESPRTDRLLPNVNNDL